jgi:hydroxyethylthiazole kinase-like sugar kinase family protein
MKNGSASTAAASDHADLKFLSVYGLVRKFRNIVLARLSEGCHLAGFVTTCAGGQQDAAAYQTYTDLGALAKKGSSVHFVAHFIDSLYVIKFNNHLKKT